jgi:hypothetical protein
MITLLSKIRSPSDLAASSFIDIIITIPTVNSSRASLLLLNRKFKYQEVYSLAKELGIDLKEHKGKNIAELYGIISSFIKKRFLDRKEKELGVLKCEYCNRRVYRDIGDRKINSATIDHKIPRAEGYDPLYDANYAVSCYRCNQQKENKPFEEWEIFYKNRLEQSKKDINRARMIGEALKNNSLKINAILNDDNTKVHKLYQIANITKISLDFLFNHLINMDIEQEDIHKSVRDLKDLIKLNIIARQKTNRYNILSIEQEFKEFFQTNKKWPRIFSLHGIKHIK